MSITMKVESHASRLFGLRHTLMALCTVGLLAACDGNSGKNLAVTPVEIDPGTSCSLDGMLLYDGQETPDYFCDTVEMFNTVLNPQQARKITAIYVQDMGKADWIKPVGQWIDAKTATYVIGSNKTGSMGPTIASFSTMADAQAFAQANGGKVLRFGEVEADQVSLDGGALHDHSM